MTHTQKDGPANLPYLRSPPVRKSPAWSYTGNQWNSYLQSLFSTSRMDCIQSESTRFEEPDRSRRSDSHFELLNGPNFQRVILGPLVEQNSGMELSKNRWSPVGQTTIQKGLEVESCGTQKAQLVSNRTPALRVVRSSSALM